MIKILVAIMGIGVFTAGLLLVEKDPFIGCAVCFVAGMFIGKMVCLNDGPDTEFPG